MDGNIPAGTPKWGRRMQGGMKKNHDRPIFRFISLYLLPDLQSAYRAMHSTETAVLEELADILLALDSGDLAMLTVLPGAALP